MLEKLMRALEPPAAYAAGEPLWNDEHISEQMLIAHLDPAYEGASRQHSFIDRSTAWIAQTLPPDRYPRLLDLGCGPGLYAGRLARLGYRVTGVDFSPRSITYAGEQAEKNGDAIEYRVQDYLSLTEREAYDAVLLIYCDYGALPPDVRARLMEKGYAALAPGGQFLLDVFTPTKLAAFEEVKSWQNRPKGGFWSGAPYVALQANRKYPGWLSLEQTVLLEENRQRTFYIWNQYFTKESLAGEAAAAGFAVQATFDDVAGEPFTGEGETMAVILAKP